MRDRSEGSQPHLINIQFPKKQSIVVSLLYLSRPYTAVSHRIGGEQEIWLYADISLDDSYTPQKLSVRAGTYHGDLHEIRLVDLPNPTGWQVIKLASEPEKVGATSGECVSLFFFFFAALLDSSLSVTLTANLAESL